MLREITDLYMKDFKIFMIDFLGHGKSDRMSEITDNIRYDKAVQTVYRKP